MPDKTLNSVVIVGAARTPVGSFGGTLSQIPATKLGSIAISGALKRCGVPKSSVDACYMGNVLSAGLGQAPARQAALGAGLPESCPCTTVNKVCASGLKAVMMGVTDIMMGHAQVVVAGGMESMSQVPHYLSARFGQMRMGGANMVDGIIHDGLTDAYDQQHMGMCAEHCARKHGVDRQQQDENARESYVRSRGAWEQGLFAEEIEPVALPEKGRKGQQAKDGEINVNFVKQDEECYRYGPDELSGMRPVFVKDGTGTVTSGNASGLNDGAAAVVLMNEELAKQMGISPLAHVVSFADAATTPVDFTTAPSLAIPKALERASLEVTDIDAFEINEAFSVVCEANMKLLGLSAQNVNMLGGAVSMGHPIGCSGTRILVTLLSILRHKGMHRGVAAICNGGGGASAMIVERRTNLKLNSNL